MHSPADRSAPATSLHARQRGVLVALVREDRLYYERGPHRQPLSVKRALLSRDHGERSRSANEFNATRHWNFKRLNTFPELAQRTSVRVSPRYYY